MRIKFRRFSLYVLTAFAFLTVLFSVCMPFASADVVQTTVSKYAFSSPIAWKETSSGVSYSLLTPFQLVLDNSVRPGVATQPNNQLSLQFQDLNFVNPALPGGHTIPFPTGGMGSPPSTVESSLLASRASSVQSESMTRISGVWTFKNNLSPWSGSPAPTFSGSFTSNGTSYGYLGFLSVGYIAYGTSSTAGVVPVYTGSWNEQGYRIVDFGETPQPCTSAFKEQMMAVCDVYPSTVSAAMEAVSVPVTINFSGHYSPDLGGVTSVQITPPAVNATATVIVDFKIFFENQSSADPLQVTFSVPSSTIIASPFGLNGLTYNFNVSESYNNGYNLGYYDGQQALRPQLEAQYNQGYSDGREYQASLGSNSFFDLISAVVDAPVLYFTKMLDFELLGFNMQSFVGAFLVIGFLIAVLRFVL